MTGSIARNDIAQEMTESVARDDIKARDDIDIAFSSKQSIVKNSCYNIILKINFKWGTICPSVNK